MLLLEGEMKSCRSYKCRRVSAHAMYQGIPVRLFFVKYGHASDFEVIVTTDTSLSFARAFETYQIRCGYANENVLIGQYKTRLHTTPYTFRTGRRIRNSNYSFNR